MNQSDITEAGRRRRVHPGVKAFVLFHMVMITSWSLPDPPPAIQNGTMPATPANVVTHFPDFLLLGNEQFKRLPTRYYLLSTGLWQYWNMFAPNPANTDFWWDAIVTYQSGKVAIMPYPRMKDLGLFEKYFKERYRKYLERMNTDATDNWKRPTFAQRMALLAYRDPQDPPVRVQLRRHYRVMEGMDKPVPEKYTEYILFDYVVDQNRLKKDAGR